MAKDQSSYSRGKRLRKVCCRVQREEGIMSSQKANTSVFLGTVDWVSLAPWKVGEDC